MTSLVKALHFTCCPSLQLLQFVQFPMCISAICAIFAICVHIHLARFCTHPCLCLFNEANALSACAPCRHCHEGPLNAWQVTTSTVLHIRRTSSTASALGQVLVKQCMQFLLLWVQEDWSGWLAFARKSSAYLAECMPSLLFAFLVGCALHPLYWVLTFILSIGCV